MSLALDLEIENKINFTIDPKMAEEAILEVLKEKGLAGNFEVTLKIVDKSEIHELNKKYRAKDKPTDVLSFPIFEAVKSKNETPVLLGDIVLCPEMVTVSLAEIIQHATLHLLGFHHPGD